MKVCLALALQVPIRALTMMDDRKTLSHPASKLRYFNYPYISVLGETAQTNVTLEKKAI